jgi:hypothetical protein
MTTTKIKIHNKPRLIPMRLFVSSLELLRKLQGVQILAAVADPDTAVLSMPKDAWKLIQETLCLDAESAAFEGGLRDEISRALVYIEEW